MEESLDAAPVTIDVTDQSISDVLGAVARRLGVQVSRTGDLYFLGTLRPEDRAVLVRRVGRLDQEELQRAVKVLLSEEGRSFSHSDGLLVVADRVEVISRVHDLLNQIDSAGIRCWVVQLYLVNWEVDRLRDYGFDVKPAAEISLNLASASAGLSSGLPAAATLDAALDVVLTAADTDKGIALDAQPLFYMVDGSEAKFEQGQRVPIPRKTVSNVGVVTTTGFIYKNVGLTVNVSLREYGGDSALLDLSIEISELVGSVGVAQAPVTSQDSFTASAVIESGGVYLLGHLKRGGQRSERATGLRWGWLSEDKRRVTQIWARAFAVAGPVEKKVKNFARPADSSLDE